VTSISTTREQSTNQIGVPHAAIEEQCTTGEAAQPASSETCPILRCCDGRHTTRGLVEKAKPRMRALTSKHHKSGTFHAACMQLFPSIGGDAGTFARFWLAYHSPACIWQLQADFASSQGCLHHSPSAELTNADNNCNCRVFFNTWPRIAPDGSIGEL